MKTPSYKMSTNLRPWAFVAFLCLLGTVVAPSYGQSTPVGTWDMVLSGSQRGLAQITFTNDFTLGGIEIITAKPHQSSSSVTFDERGGINHGEERDPQINTATNSSVETTNLYGRAYLSGTWTYDNRGGVIGILIESGKITVRTNGISFKAKVRPGVRMSMVATRDNSTIHYSGVPLVALPDQSANYYGVGKRAGNGFNELFTLTPAATVLPEPIVTFPSGFVNGYDVVGIGPAYGFVGGALFSSQKKMALYTSSDAETNGVVRGITGSYRTSKGAGELSGLVSNGPGQDNVRLKVYRQAAP